MNDEGDLSVGASVLSLDAGAALPISQTSLRRLAVESNARAARRV
jgi:hypothetical protein